MQGRMDRVKSSHSLERKTKPRTQIPITDRSGYRLTQSPPRLHDLHDLNAQYAAEASRKNDLSRVTSPQSIQSKRIVGKGLEKTNFPAHIAIENFVRKMLSETTLLPSTLLCIPILNQTGITMDRRQGSSQKPMLKARKSRHWGVAKFADSCSKQSRTAIAICCHLHRPRRTVTLALYIFFARFVTKGFVRDGLSCSTKMFAYSVLPFDFCT